MGSHIGKVGLSKSFAISDASDIKESNKRSMINNSHLHDMRLDFSDIKLNIEDPMPSSTHMKKSKRASFR